MATEEGDMNTNGNGIAEVGDTQDVKPDIVKKEFQPNFEVKEEPSGDGDETNGKRVRRKVSNINMAELSDSEGSEGLDQPVKKKAKTATRGRGAKKVPAGMSPTVVLESIDGVSPTSTPKQRGRGRGRGAGRGAAASAGGRGSGRKRAPAKKFDDEEDEAEEDEEDDIEDSGEDAEISDESEDEWVGEDGKKKKTNTTPTVRGRGRGRGGAGRGGAGRGGGRSAKKAAAPAEEEEENEEEEEDLPPINEAAVNDLSGPVRTGQFMIEKNDTKHLENYPIWRMEGPNMLRKFEMIVSDGKIRHKSLYAYSSWAQTMTDLYSRIQVQQLSSSDGEITVEVKSDYIPQSPSLESLQSKYAGDELVPSFQKFTEALFNQAASPTFLSTLKDSGDSSYLLPINQFDDICADAVRRIESEVNMKEEFMTRVKSCPNMKGIKRQNWSQTDQATVDKVTEKGVRSVLMFGYGYEPFLMTEDSSKGVEVAQEIIIGSTMEKYLRSYHGLVHFKFHLLKRCQDKLKVEKGLNAGMSDDDVMARCIGDHVWILGAYDELKALLTW